jgi:hypothetical protein
MIPFIHSKPSHDPGRTLDMLRSRGFSRVRLTAVGGDKFLHAALRRGMTTQIVAGEIWLVVGCGVVRRKPVDAVAAA